MSMFSKKKAPPRPQEELQQIAIADQQRGSAAAWQPVVTQRLAQIANMAPRIAEQRGYANADTAQRVGPLVAGSNATPFQRAMQRGSALTRIARAGDSAVEQQQLRDRMSMARFGTGLQTNTAGQYGALAQLTAAQDAQKMRLDQDRRAGMLNAIGVAGGAAASAYSDKFKDAWQNMMGVRRVIKAGAPTYYDDTSQQPGAYA